MFLKSSWRLKELMRFSETSGEAKALVRIHRLKFEKPLQSPCHYSQIAAVGRSHQVVVGAHFTWQYSQALHQPWRQNCKNRFRKLTLRPQSLLTPMQVISLSFVSPLTQLGMPNFTVLSNLSANPSLGRPIF
jgi:hypothetical protein